MKEDSIITNILSIVGAGLLILLTGVAFLVFRDYIYKHIRFFLPIPPIAVAAYIYVYNFYLENDGLLANDLSKTIKDVLSSIGIASLSFSVFVVLLILFINVVRKLFQT